MHKLTPIMLQRLILSVGTNMDKRPLTPVEVAEAFEDEITAGTSAQELAQACHLSDATMVGRFRRLLNLSNTVRHLVDWGKRPSTLSFTVATQLARIQSLQVQEALCTAALEFRLSASEIQQVIQIMDRAEVTLKDAINNVIRLRRTVERQYVFIGVILTDNLRLKLRLLSQNERNELLMHAVRKRYFNLARWGGTLGSIQFSLVGDSVLASHLSSVPGGFEQAVNDMLLQEVH